MTKVKESDSTVFEEIQISFDQGLLLHFQTVFLDATEENRLFNELLQFNFITFLVFQGRELRDDLKFS